MGGPVAAWDRRTLRTPLTSTPQGAQKAPETYSVTNRRRLSLNAAATAFRIALLILVKAGRVCY